MTDQQRAWDRAYARSAKGRARGRAYNCSEKGLARRARYRGTPRELACDARYAASGRAAVAQACRLRYGVPLRVFEEIGFRPSGRRA